MSSRFDAGQLTMAGFYQRDERIVPIIADEPSEGYFLSHNTEGRDCGAEIRWSPSVSRTDLHFIPWQDSCRLAVNTTQAYVMGRESQAQQ